MGIRSEQLRMEIEQCRDEMMALAGHFPLTNQRVVDLSTKLDGLLNQYYNLFIKKQ